MDILARHYTGRMRGFALRPINSMKNSVNFSGGLSSTQVDTILAKAVNSPQSAAAPEEVVHGATIKAMYIILDVCGLGGTGVLNNFGGYLMKNPGASLTPPAPGGIGTSNEKKFIIKEWAGMIMRNQDGNAPLHWEGWIKIPRRYHRMGTDDTWLLSVKCSSGVTGHFSMRSIYKWYS